MMPGLGEGKEFMKLWELMTKEGVTRSVKTHIFVEMKTFKISKLNFEITRIRNYIFFKRE